ncbi:MAG: hypothetical protein KC800_30595, partial [Candidatus Eremiobacteraeota bacterium]|nr:hypothetical protein [Candidatus Eremiobacteraeota bacterium]
LLLNGSGCSAELPGGGANISDEVVAKGKMDECKAHLRDIATALENYADANSGKYPPVESGLSALVPDYLEELPLCPVGGEKQTYTYYGTDHETNIAKLKSYYYIECHGGNHTKAGVEGDFPAFSTILQGISDQADLDESIKQFKARQAVEKEEPEEPVVEDDPDRQF